MREQSDFMRVKNMMTNPLIDQPNNKIIIILTLDNLIYNTLNEMSKLYSSFWT